MKYAYIVLECAFLFIIPHVTYYLSVGKCENKNTLKWNVKEDRWQNRKSRTMRNNTNIFKHRPKNRFSIKWFHFYFHQKQRKTKEPNEHDSIVGPLFIRNIHCKYIFIVHFFQHQQFEYIYLVP